MKQCHECSALFESKAHNAKFCSKKCKAKHDDRAYRLRHKEKVRAAKSAWKKTPKGRYWQHKGNAERRGHEFNLSFDEWWSLWEEHWDNRGRGSNQICMCRIGDQGAYEIGNVYMDTGSANRSLSTNRLQRESNGRLKGAAQCQ